MTTQFMIAEEYGRNSAKKLVVHDTDILNFEARLAANLVERWGLVAGVPDGEDSTGRSKLGLLPPAEIVARACDTAQLLSAEFRKRDWIVEGPDVSELLRKTDD